MLLNHSLPATDHNKTPNLHANLLSSDVNPRAQNVLEKTKDKHNGSLNL
jgi:hypothetical protein